MKRGIQGSNTDFLIYAFAAIEKLCIFTKDVGLAVYLNGIENQSQIVNYPLRGAFFENLIVTEFLKERYNVGKKSNLYFYRDSKDNEVGLVYDSPDCIKAYEIKSSQTPATDFVKGIQQFKNAIEKEVAGFVYYAGSEKMIFSDIEFVP